MGRHDITELDVWGSAVKNEQVGGDKEDMCEDSCPTYIYDYIRLSPEGVS